MISDKYILSEHSADLLMIPNEAEMIGRYSGLEKKYVRRLRLLSEEMICMLPQLLSYGSGSFWIESEGTRFNLYLSVLTDRSKHFPRGKPTVGTKSESEDKRGSGSIIARICAAIESMMSEKPKAAKKDSGSENIWSLKEFKRSLGHGESDREAWDELEKSIIANLSDDVVITMKSGKFDIVVKIDFG